MESNAYATWNEYVKNELAVIEPLLVELGYTLDEFQPHIAGERYLMQAVTTTSGRKLILLGTRSSDGMHVVVKATRDHAGKAELTHERTCRTAIHAMPFAYHIFNSPKELFFGERNDVLFSVQEFIEQTSPFLARPIEEQFSFALSAFKAQEGAHAATHELRKKIQHVFGTMNATEYQKVFAGFVENIKTTSTDEALHSNVDAAEQHLRSHTEYIEQYGNFLTHTDFVPHNFRIRDGILYLLDYSSLRFGNKHEGWARFLNFMVLYNPELEAAFLQYFKDNRAPEEMISLRTMRIYRLGEIIWYYQRSLSASTDNLYELNAARVKFWSSVLEAALQNKPVSPEIRTKYIERRDELRSEDERKRQKDLH